MDTSDIALGPPTIDPKKKMNVTCSSSSCQSCSKQIPPSVDSIDLKTINNMSKDQRDLLHWHLRLDHLAWRHVQDLARRGYIGNKRLATIKPPVCLGCQLGKAHRLSTTKGSKIIGDWVKQPGDLVHTDQAETTQPGRPLTHSGWNNKNKIFVFTVYFDSISKRGFVEFQHSTDADATISGKHRIDRVMKGRLNDDDGNNGVIPVLSRDAIVAICGILSMLSLRAPGAAVAIAQHRDILPRLISATLEPGQSDHKFVVDPKVALPTVYLLCIICGQSRSAAKSLQLVAGNILCIIASEADHEAEWHLQQWCIILWRILLRYGLCLSSLSTILPLSIRYLADDARDIRTCPTPEYLSAYAVICECVKIATLHGGSQSLGGKNFISGSDRETLAMSGMWLSSHAKNCADSFMASTDKVDDPRKRMKLMASRLRFLSCYFDASSPSP